MRTTKKQHDKPKEAPADDLRSRAAVLSDFRKVVGPPKAPRGRKKPKPAS